MARAFRWHPWLDGRCLPRALVQYLLHLRDGVPAQFVIGVRHARRTGLDALEQGAPLDAHAWVQSPGDDGGEEAGYAPI